MSSQGENGVEERLRDPIVLDTYVDVEYTVDDPAEEMVNEKHYPITIHAVFFRGENIYRLLHVSHILLLQRRIYFKLLDSGELPYT